MKRRCLLLLSAALLAAPGFAAAQAGGAQVLERIVRRYRKNPSAANYQELLGYARTNKGEAGGLALLAAGMVKAENGRHGEAVADLKRARERLSRTADYAALALASAYVELKDFGQAREEAARVIHHDPPSPLAGQAVLVAARAELELGRAGEAVRLLEREGEGAASAAGRLLLAASLEASRQLAAAAAQYPLVYSEFPLSEEAAKAAAALARLEASLGAAYPAPPASSLLGRIQRLIDARQYATARKELLALIPRLGGADRDTARVRLGANAYLAGRTSEAHKYLASLQVATAAAGAERLYYLLACARRLERSGEIAAYQKELAAKHPESPWRLKALIAEANHHLLGNRVSEYVPLFKACYESFPDDPGAGYCHWKAAWAEYRQRGPGAAALFREHLSLHPASEKAPAALYFLGRLAEERREWSAARSYYARIGRIAPNSYYGTLVRQRLEQPSLSAAKADREVEAFLAGVRFPDGPPWRDFQPSPAARKRMERARLLASAALDEQAQAELRFAARTEGQGHVLALELAQMEARGGAPDRAIRSIKSLAPAYLSAPVESAPDRFWKLAFPLAFREHLVRHSRQRSLDPFLVAGLIRQESEFNPRAVSPSRAYGLTQVLPRTGRSLSRKVGIRRFSTSLLFRPDVNLNLGTYYVRSLLDQLGGSEELMLAAYNAGKSRVDVWVRWGPFREPAEFIETIPITETRTYVQAVLRNADFYRRLYGEREVASAAPPGR